MSPAQRRRCCRWASRTAISSPIPPRGRGRPRLVRGLRSARQRRRHVIPGQPGIDTLGRPSPQTRTMSSLTMSSLHATRITRHGPKALAYDVIWRALWKVDPTQGNDHVQPVRTSLIRCICPDPRRHPRSGSGERLAGSCGPTGYCLRPPTAPGACRPGHHRLRRPRPRLARREAAPVDDDRRLRDRAADPTAPHRGHQPPPRSRRRRGRGLQ